MSRNNRCDCTAEEHAEEYACILENMICDMRDIRCSDSISGDFIRLMIPHHRAAVEMCKNIIRCTDDEDVCCLAKAILERSNEMIEDLRDIMRCCDGVRNCCDNVRRWRSHTGRCMRQMFNRMKRIRIDDDMECNFLRAMIPHRMGALGIAEHTMCYCLCGDLCPVLRKMCCSMEEEMEQLTRLLRRFCCRR